LFKEIVGAISFTGRRTVGYVIVRAGEEDHDVSVNLGAVPLTVTINEP
jgi:hypothetical protein